MFGNRSFILFAVVLLVSDVAFCKLHPTNVRRGEVAENLLRSRLASELGMPESPSEVAPIENEQEPRSPVRMNLGPKFWRSSSEGRPAKNDHVPPSTEING